MDKINPFYYPIMLSNPRIAVFYDGNYLLHCSNYYNYIHPMHKRISIGGLHKFLCGTIQQKFDIKSNNLTVSQSHYFRGRLGAADAFARGNQLYNDRVFDDILMAEGVHTHYMPLRGVGTRREESGTTVALALTVQYLVIEQQVDIAVLVIADTDYVPLMRMLRTMGVPSVIVGWEFEYVNDEGMRMTTRTSAELLNLASCPLPMASIIEHGLDLGDPLVEGLFVASTDNRLPAITTESLTSTIMSLKNGFGFIRYPNNNLFFHSADVDGCEFSELKIGDAVQFEIAVSEQGQEIARKVRRAADCTDAKKDDKSELSPEASTEEVEL